MKPEQRDYFAGQSQFRLREDIDMATGTLLISLIGLKFAAFIGFALRQIRSVSE